MLRRVAAIAAACLVALHAGAAEYHGFRIDEDSLHGQLSAAAAASLQEQLAIVEAAGLPPAVLASFKATTILVDPDLRGNPGVFSVQGGSPAVRVRPIVFPQNKPILLHELLHAYHYQVLSMRNRDIDQAYRRAMDKGLFAQFRSSHFLENQKEFFAVSGTLFLFGDIAQPPFRCEALNQLGQAYLAFLEAQFGPHECHGKAPASDE
jgi:hypothetical protein